MRDVDVPHRSATFGARIYRINAALAEAEGAMIGAQELNETATLATASSIAERTKAIGDLLKNR